MPLLKAEPAIYPDAIFALDYELFPWHVAHVKSRQEKTLARRLHALGIAFYLPQTKKVNQRSGRKFESYLPLIPGYLFFRGARESVAKALRSGVILRILKVDEQLQFTAELSQIHDLISAGAIFTVEPRFSVGDQVVIQGGSFSGYWGTVVEQGRRTRLLVTITVLRTLVSVEFDPEVLVKNSPGLVMKPAAK